jgi:hypothetical protein
MAFIVFIIRFAYILELYAFKKNQNSYNAGFIKYVYMC